MSRNRRIAPTIIALLLAATIFPSPSRARTTDVVARTAPARMLVSAQGMTLYVFTADSTDQSNCYGGCARFWPPLLVPAGVEAPATLAGVAGTFGVATRHDGSRQLTYDGVPLYTFLHDAAPGDMHGQGLFSSWWVVAAPAATTAAAGVDASSLVATAPADVLVTAQGMALYVFAPDTADRIACVGACARFWPPLRAAAGTSPLAGLLQIEGDFGLTLRPDGGQQLTYDGAPLYTFIHDAQPGDMHGQGVLSIWWAVVVPSLPPPGGSVTNLTSRQFGTRSAT